MKYIYIREITEMGKEATPQCVKKQACFALLKLRERVTVTLFLRERERDREEGWCWWRFDLRSRECGEASLSSVALLALFDTAAKFPLSS